MPFVICLTFNLSVGTLEVLKLVHITSRPVVPHLLIWHATILGKRRSLILVVLAGGSGHCLAAQTYLDR